MKKIILAAVLGLLIGATPVLAQGSLSLSQTNVFVNVGQNTTISVYPPSGQIANIISISNTYVAYANITNNVVTVYGLANGNTDIQLSTYDNYSATIHVTVGNGSGNSNPNNGTISFSQNNVSLNIGQTSSVSIYNNNNQNFNNTYYISNNSNNNVVSASISGNTINLYGMNSGSTTLTVYSNQNSDSATLYVTVGGNNNYGNLVFSQNNFNLNVGQTRTVSVSNNSGSLYISSNSQNYIASAYVSNNQVTITGVGVGSTSIVVNSSNNQTGTIYVTVGGGSNNTSISFSQNNVNLNVGQSRSVSIYNNNNNSNFNSYYISNNSNNNVVSASISGNTINLYGMNSGSTSITVYSNQNSNNPATLYVTVGGSNNNNSGNLYFSNTTPTQATTGQYYTYSLQVSGGNSPYSYSLYSGSMPSGLNLSSNGIISGTPTTSGNYNISVRVTDYSGRSLISQTIYLNVTNSGIVSGTSIYANGTLINENGTIYIVYKNTKTGFGNLTAFRGLGYRLNNVITGSGSSMINSGFVVASANIAHPWGSWIKSGSTIYFVHDQGLIPISTHDVFINNGGRDNLVVPANSYDFSKPILDLMSLGDPRLR